MSSPLSRRKMLTSGLAAAGGIAGLAVASRLANRFGLLPPDGCGVYGPGETLTYATQRILTAHALAREFSRSEISKVAPITGYPPETDPYQRLLAGGFADWRLALDGLVARPSSFSLAELKRFPPCSQITEHICEQGWSFVAEWIGVPLSFLMNRAGVLPQARYVLFYALDGAWGSLDMQDAWHPQTLIAYGMNGPELPLEHGAPARLRVPRQLGYKSIKFLSRVTLTDSLKNVGKGLGASVTEGGYSWYAGI